MSKVTKLSFEIALSNSGAPELAKYVGPKNLHKLWKKVPVHVQSKELIFANGVALGMELALEKLQEAQKDTLKDGS